MVVWTLPAKNDLRQIYNSIAYDSKIYAKRVTKNIAAKPDILDGLPRIGKVVDELKNDKIRQLPIYTYRIIYEVSTDDVYILAIVQNDRTYNQKASKVDYKKLSLLL